MVSGQGGRGREERGRRIPRAQAHSTTHLHFRVASRQRLPVVQEYPAWHTPLTELRPGCGHMLPDRCAMIRLAVS